MSHHAKAALLNLFEVEVDLLLLVSIASISIHDVGKVATDLERQVDSSKQK